jgi:M6 family metalloprotease-like protein
MKKKRGEIGCNPFLFAQALCLMMLVPVAHGQLIPFSSTGVKKWSPVQKPTSVGPINVGMVLVLFPDTELRGGVIQFKKDLDNLNGLTLEEYFKVYSNGITWPVVKIFPDEDPADIYRAPQLYGYYCKFDSWGNPIGWRSAEEGQKRATLLKSDAFRAAKAKAGTEKFKTMAVAYVTTRIADAARRPDIRRYYAGNFGKKSDDYPDPTAAASAKGAGQPRADPPALVLWNKPFQPYDFYKPQVAWGEPMWPNSSIQMNDAAAGTFAHEFGHVLGAPDLYRVGRSNDGIGGTAALLTYGPTATAFARFYNHGFVSEKFYPTITRSGTYTLYPRHIKPEKDQAIGFVIPSRHPHYFYQIEYIYGENPALGVGGGGEGQTSSERQYQGNTNSVEGVLISVLNLRVSSYLGSPDLFYTYRPNDPWFRGRGDVKDCLFGTQFNRTEFNMTTEPSARLPNLLDGGVVFKNITEHQGTATFDIEIDRTPLTSEMYERSLLPQIKLDPIDQILPTSFRMTTVHKFRGEPLIDQFGMCWSKSKNPEVSNDKFVLCSCNGEMYQGRALNLTPGTTYYVRAWASNSKGLRYSDDELTVKTPPMTADATDIGPLLLDDFSNNSLLHDRFSNDAFDGYGTKQDGYESYAPVAVLAKLAAYYHPDGLLASHAGVGPDLNPRRGMGSVHELLVDASTAKKPVDFGRLHWSPDQSDPAIHKAETLALFDELRTQARASKMYGLTLTADFPTGFDRMFRHRLQPQFVHVTAANLDDVLKQIKTELINGRPVLVMESPKPLTGAPKLRLDHDKRIQWGVIDGLLDRTSVHIDFPADTEFLKEEHDRRKFTTLDSLLIKDYDLAITTHISF